MLMHVAHTCIPNQAPSAEPPRVAHARYIKIDPIAGSIILDIFIILSRPHRPMIERIGSLPMESYDSYIYYIYKFTIALPRPLEGWWRRRLHAVAKAQCSVQPQIP